MKKLVYALAALSILWCQNVAAGTSGPSGIYSASSPLAKAEHPRLFVAQGKISNLVGKIQSFYRADYQRFVDHMDGLYTLAPKTGDWDKWNHVIGITRAYSFLYLVDPDMIGGIQSKYKKNDYGRKALEYALYLAKNLPEDWNEEHHGAKNLSTDNGGLASLALQVAYDWTYTLSSLDERRAIADRLIIMWDNRYDSDKVKLENHYTANAHIYAGALCFYGDTDLGPAYQPKAQEMMDSFQQVFLTGQLAVAEKLYEGSSDWIEGDSYGLDAFTSIMFLAAAAESATNINYFYENPWLRYAPYYLYYNIVPKPYKGEHFYSQQNTSSVKAIRDSDTSQIWNIIAAMLADDDPNMAGFASWFSQNSALAVDVDSFDHYSPHLHDVFFKFIFGARHVEPLPPQQANVPLSLKLGQMHAMRSEHESDDATLIHFYATKYWYANGHNEEEQSSFVIHRFGPLAISAANSKNGGDLVPRVDSNGKGFIQNNVVGINDFNPEMPVELGKIRSTFLDDPHFYTDGSPIHIGDVTAREMTSQYDYVNYNYSRSYIGGLKASSARRAMVYLRGQINDEYVVVMDRINSPYEKYFIMHTPVDLQGVNSSWQSMAEGHWKTNGDILKVENRIDQAHGQMYVHSVFPQSKEIHKYGGPGYEWVWADGSRLDYDPSEFTEFAAYMLSNHTLQIRSQEGRFLTVMHIGDANTIGGPTAVTGIEGSEWFGALINEKRAVLFSKTEKPLTDFTYTISTNNRVEHLVTELKPDQLYSVMKNGNLLLNVTSSSEGTITFNDIAGANGQYRVVQGTTTSVEGTHEHTIPSEIGLSNYPNPFNPTTTVQFDVPMQGQVQLAIFNTQGQLVRKLLTDNLTAGSYRIEWDGNDNSGIRAASGAYFLRLKINNFSKSHMIVLAK